MKPRTRFDPQMDTLASLCVIGTGRIILESHYFRDERVSKCGWIRRKQPSSKGCSLSLRSRPNPLVLLKRCTIALVNISSLIFHHSLIRTLGSSLTEVLAVARIFHALFFLPDFYHMLFVVYTSWEFLKEVRTSLPLGSTCQAELRVSTFVHPWYLEIYFFWAYAILWNFCVHIFPLHWIVSSWRETGLGTIQVLNKCLPNGGFDY